MPTTSADIGAPAVVVAPIATAKVGAPVYALGSPLGLDLSLTAGLISALRNDAKGNVQSIQVSAVTAPGSSGGGLFDAEGRLIGVTVAIAGQSGGGIGFAILAGTLLDLVDRREAALDDWHALLRSSGVPVASDGYPLASRFATIDDVTSVPSV